jgi:hypothetical protein
MMVFLHLFELTGLISPSQEDAFERAAISTTSTFIRTSKGNILPFYNGDL